ncbi:putative translation factor (SUA5) [secondary endosymbiont of Heteropsylla cubana]|uniref:Threonylcarbamoyl-AMP synthase n=1 Tax=secondary endosymbiont of Heteropsylla cubana TaxID=134287 RepID=J3YTG9_9ENTR|nr:Sua5/YciO/YrdC/YwlC family protein [secondary endosymbiont of Heteropsylla cubana]AFP85753.1 putative translation factor (SUA5) [secondary endosymbiont of Heteropsylla cubana]
MKITSLSSNITDLVFALHNQDVIAYPTEAVFGLGCDPEKKYAVQALLKLKKRSWEKGFILVAAHYTQLKKYINNEALNEAIKTRIFSSWPGPITWVIPAHPATPIWITGTHKSIAVRVSAFEPIQRLSLAFGKALISTSANLTGQPPAMTAEEIREQFGTAFPVLEEAIAGQKKPSIILDALSGKVIRNN